MSTIEEKLQTIAENTPKVYESGKREGMNAFWDPYQDLGKRTKYDYGFCEFGWTDELFKPKYDMVVSSASRMFLNSGITDIKTYFKSESNPNGVLLDFSTCTTFTNTFQSSSVEKIGVLDTSSASALTYVMYQASSVKTIDEFILKDDGSQTWNLSNSFANCTNLEEVRFKGKIGTNNFNVQWSVKLSHDSLMSIINCLADKTGVSGTWKVTIGTTNLAKLTSDEIKIASNKGWTVD